jgi:hypothetical protein
VFFAARPEQLAELSSALKQHHIGRLSYVAGQQWWRDQQTLRQADMVCSSVEKLPMALELLDCREARWHVPTPPPSSSAFSIADHTQLGLRQLAC